ncbi:reverse transcriptase, partial [Phytophthora megakarya]
RRPPRVTRHHREHRLDEALDDLHTVERASPSDRTAIRRARRRVGRVNSAITQQLLRSRFDKEEKTCVEEILAAARAQRASAHTTASCNGTAPPPAATATDDGLCPIPSAELWRFFDGVNTPLQEFVPDAATGATFRSAMARLPTASRFRELLTEAPTLDDIETQLQHVRGASSPGLDGVGYDVYQKFAVQLLPALGAAFKRCWEAKKVPLSWKLGVVRLLYKKGERTDPANWRPICLQQAVYKLYSGVLARRLGRWLDANDRHAPGQKGFRAVNGCGEHNFLAATLVDQARRKRRTLFEVWYDFRNAFGSVPFALLWDSLARLGVPDDYVAMCKGLYESAAFVVGNAEDGTTDPVHLRVGVFQGCPLSPQLFNAAISPLLFALQRLPDTGVQLSTDDRLGASAYADDLKTFSSTEDGIKRQHALVVDFLRWTGMAANPSKCCTMSVQRDHRGVLKTCDLGLELDGDPIPALGMADSYSYLGIGDGFDHVRRRVELAPALKQLKDDATALLQSGLAPWQVVKATKTYLYPRVEYALRHLRPFQQQLEGFDRHLVRGLRHLLRLPVSATTEFLYAPVSRGGLGLLPLTELHAAIQVAHGWQMLHSKDPAIRRIARVQLRQIADARHRVDTQAWADREDELCEKLLNSQLGASPDAPPKRRNGDIGQLSAGRVARRTTEAPQRRHWFTVGGHPAPSPHARTQARDSAGVRGDWRCGCHATASRAASRAVARPRHRVTARQASHQAQTLDQVGRDEGPREDRSHPRRCWKRLPHAASRPLGVRLPLCGSGATQPVGHAQCPQAPASPSARQVQAPRVRALRDAGACAEPLLRHNGRGPWTPRRRAQDHRALAHRGVQRQQGPGRASHEPDRAVARRPRATARPSAV